MCQSAPVKTARLNVYCWLTLWWSLAVGVVAQAQTPVLVGPEFLVNTFTTSAQVSSDIAMDSAGNFIITWQGGGDQDGDNVGIFAQRFMADGTPDGPEFQVNTFVTSSQTVPSIAMDSASNFVITWTSIHQDGSNFGIFAQRFLADGTPDGSEFQVNTYTPNNQTNPDVAMDDAGNFMIAWSSCQGVTSVDVKAQRYLADGTPNGPEFLVNTTTADAQQNPDVAMHGAGNFVITWNSRNQDGGGRGVYAQRFQPDGTPVGPEFLVNTTTADDQEIPSIAIDDASNFVIAWQSLNQDGDGFGAYAQRFLASGAPDGPEFRLSSVTAGDQKFPIVAMDAADNILMTWESFGQDTVDSIGSFARRYQADGTPLGAEFQVNTFTSNDQRVPVVAMDNTGRVAITWSSDSQDGDHFGIYAQRFQLPVSESTPPTCALAALNPGPPATLVVETQDPGSGIASIEVLILDNATVEIPQGSGNFFSQGETATFIPPTANLTVLEAEKTSAGMASQLMIRVTDSFGNMTTCDPVVANLVVPAAHTEVHQTFNHIPPEEHLITIQNGQNGAPGLHSIMIEVNGHLSREGHLAQGVSHVFDVALDMIEAENTITITGIGPPGAQALMIISDVPPPPRC